VFRKRSDGRVEQQVDVGDDRGRPLARVTASSSSSANRLNPARSKPGASWA
jgi:hypothetical protein